MNLSASARATLERVCDQLIPPSMGMPSANDLDVPGAGFARLAAVNPAAAEGLAAALEDTGETDVFEIKENQPDLFLVLSSTISSVYLTEQDVMDRLGYLGRPPLPYPDYEAEARVQTKLSEPVRARGFIWQSTPQPVTSTQER